MNDKLHPDAEAALRKLAIHLWDLKRPWTMLNGTRRMISAIRFGMRRKIARIPPSQRVISG